MSTDRARRRPPARRWSSDLCIAVLIGLGMVVVYVPRAWAAVDMGPRELLWMTADVFVGWAAMGFLIVATERGVAGRFDSLALRIACVVATAVGARLVVPMSLQVLDGTHNSLGAAPAAMRLELIWTTIVCAAGTAAYLDRAASRQAADATLASLRREERQARRELVEGRLQVLQARVDPQLFFEMLGSVRDRYAVDPARAETLLERLTVFLRAALPRLRTPLPCLAQEVALASAYVDLRREAGSTAATLAVELDAAAGQRGFPAGVLLPLLDAVLQAPVDPVVPTRLRLRAVHGAQGVALSLTGSTTTDPPVVDAVRRTLHALYAENAGVTVRRARDGCWEVELVLHDTPSPDTAPRTDDTAQRLPWPVRVAVHDGTAPGSAGASDHGRDEVFHA